MNHSCNHEEHARFINIEGVVNFRDLGGYQNLDGRTVKWSQLYRAGQLDRISEAGIATLQALKVSTVVDLRFAQETERYPTKKAAVPNARFITWSDFISQERKSAQHKMSWHDALESGDPIKVREAMRDNYPQKLYSHRHVFRAMLEAVIVKDTPLVFHCAAGKDRTGIGAALILALLEVPFETIRQDYALSQREMPKLREAFRAGGAAQQSDYDDFQKSLARYPSALTAPIFDADIDYLDEAIDHVARTFGDFHGYATEVLKFDRDQQRRLQDTLLESP